MTVIRLLVLACAVAAALHAGPASAQTTLRVVMHSDLKILDPIWTAAYITRNHGYMIYDTLFAMDAAGKIRPQMVDRYDASPDRLTHTMTLREGLLWHDGDPVTAADCVASIRRWGAKDSLGQKLMSFVKDLVVVDDRTFRILLREPTGLVLEALGKPGSNVPFMMPRRVADTPPGDQISDFTGSGPFIFKRDEWKPGDRTVYVKNPRYRPRPEPPSGLAGGKLAKVDRVEWRAIADHQTAINALSTGEVDLVEAPPHDLYPVLKKDPNIKLVPWQPLGLQFAFRFNTLHPPFDNATIRQALWYAFNQEDFLMAAVGDPAYYRICKSLFPCGSPLETTKGMEGLLTSNVEQARALLRQGGYDGTPIVLLHSTDVGPLANLAPVAKSLMEKVGFRVTMQSMDWQTLLARLRKKEPPAQGGWHGFLTAWASIDILNPAMMGFLNAACDKALVGWPCDEEIERLRDQYARETNPARLRALAEAVQVRASQYPTHIPLGQWFGSAAARTTLEGFVQAPVTVLWNIEQKGR
jgi:peptide/nickel transport system substrate-binding protein